MEQEPSNNLPDPLASKKRTRSEVKQEPSPLELISPKRIKTEIIEPTEPVSTPQENNRAKRVKREVKREPKMEQEVKREIKKEQEQEEKKSPTKKTPTKKTPVKKSPTKKSPAKKSPAAKRTPKRKREESDEEDEDEEEDDEKKNKKRKKSTGKKEKTPKKEEDLGREWWKEDNENWRKGKKKNWKWRTLEHNGVYFPPSYVPHGVKMLYDGKPVDLTPDQEEMVTFFVRYMDTDHMKKPQFTKNFWKGFKTSLGKNHVIKIFSKCDFAPVYDYVKEKQEERKKRSKEEKEKEKEEKAEIKEKYGYAIIDGISFLNFSRRLKKFLKKIRKDYESSLKEKDDFLCQRATAMWVIDDLALRVGNDKGKDQADTVGCCSLRKEHVKLHKPRSIEFDFLGKDSMRYHNTVEVPEVIFKNFQRFHKGKKKGEQLFDKLNPAQLNAHLQTLMKGLTAKVFRTYNASQTMQQELLKLSVEESKKMSVEERILFFNRSSVQVAVLCNHQRSVSKTHSVQMEKLDKQIEDTKTLIKEMKDHLARLKAGKTPKERGKDENGEDLKAFSTNPDTVQKRIDALEDKIRKILIKKEEKDNLKEVSTSTSKVNYIDPRVSLAWCIKHDVPIQKIFSKTMRTKFAWAIHDVQANNNYEF